VASRLSREPALAGSAATAVSAQGRVSRDATASDTAGAARTLADLLDSIHSKKGGGASSTAALAV